MKVIEKIEIKNFRSFGNRKGGKTQVIKINDLNIFSGANDSGKSNILRALNLFFNKSTNLGEFLNFEKDFFVKENDDDDDIKQELITIKISFINSRNSGKNSKNKEIIRLPERFWVSRKWLRGTEFSNYSQDSSELISFKKEKQEFYNNLLDKNGELRSNFKASLSKQLTDFLNSIQYHYIPAIKDKNYFAHLFGELQQTLLKEKISDVNDSKNKFEKAIQKSTNLLMDEFKLKYQQ
jgi:AAA15 family ATPase/GTPase